MTSTLEHLEAAPDLWHELDGMRIPHWRIGRGPDLLFVHGWPLDARTWRVVVDELSDRFTCHLIDLPGAGRSEWDEHLTTSVQTYADVVSAAIDAIDAPHVGLVAHDSGGSFARVAAAMRPQKISGVVLANTEIPGYHPWRLEVLFAASRRPFLHRVLKTMASTSIGQYMLLRDSMVDRELMLGEFSQLFFEPLATSPRSFEGALLLPTGCDVEDFDILRDVHPRVTCPVHLVWGARDPWFPLAKGEEMSAQFGGEVSWCVVPGCKLLVHEDEPAVFIREVAAHFGVE